MKTKNVIIVALICTLTMLSSCFFPVEGGKKHKKEKQPVKVEKKYDNDNRR